jgi:hypothetical protein
VFAAHSGFGFVALVLFLLWLLAASLALTIRASREARHDLGLGKSVDRGADAMKQRGLATRDPRADAGGGA